MQFTEALSTLEFYFPGGVASSEKYFPAEIDDDAKYVLADVFITVSASDHSNFVFARDPITGPQQSWVVGGGT